MSRPADRWEAKYKTLRAAFLAWRRLERAREKGRAKERQRLIELCYGGLRAKRTPDCFRNYELLLGRLGISGYGPSEPPAGA
jgi:hypothetical protein